MLDLTRDCRYLISDIDYISYNGWVDVEGGGVRLEYVCYLSDFAEGGRQIPFSIESARRYYEERVPRFFHGAISPEDVEVTERATPSGFVDYLISVHIGEDTIREIDDFDTCVAKFFSVLDSQQTFDFQVETVWPRG